VNALAATCFFVCAGLDAHVVGIEGREFCICADGIEKFSVPIDPCDCSFTDAPLAAALLKEESDGSPQEKAP
jgi:hypothetical protein